MDDITPTSDTPGERLPAKRDALGRLLPGEVLNPKGRGLGVKNKNTLLMEKLESELLEMLATDSPEILSTAIARAKKGNDAMLKLLLDKVLPMRKAESGNEKKATPSITINVGRTGSEGVQVSEADSKEEQKDEGQ